MARSVLVVDDEPNIVLSLEFLLKQVGYDVHVARDGEAALEAIAAHKPGLVLLDVMMPKRDGYDVCQTVRANPAWNDIRIIMLTAKGREVEREKGLALGADEYVTKPFSTRDVVEKVRSFLGNP
ncbi:response regulator transcription factor [Magnetospirillum sulfuroxidans]|uniref:Response regulator n=1 Tax=Magnetospirillum sulfuroxidans TaxID=611300 RepID=A0ABS5IHH1_9PROT|nr:response regulator [Magnetospirillum sulfuroxidans]MBR9973867.1 response regulator [Magnetospirillum sulfuroxidans]